MTKSKPQVKIIDCTTGEEIVRDANAEEIAEIEASKAEQLSNRAEAEAKEASRQSILDRIGLTSEELKTILG